MHVFSNHKHAVCFSKIEKHIHKKDLDCKLHIIKQGQSFLTKNTYQLKLTTSIYNISSLQYYFLKKHFQLSFSLRGPPLKN